ncbi:MAG: DUF2267 domain-containing protein [Balneolaceae bacterium]|nr:DUF2267 domain-containing protein [Balneolaceae bacterium]
MENRVNVNLEKYLVETGQWIDEVATHLDHTERKDWAFNALRSVLHVIRDRTITEEAFQLSAQLPMLLRGLFFEGYQLSNKPEKFHLDEMLNRIEEGMGPASDFTPEQVFKAVLLVLNDHISKGELNDIYASMPKDIKSIWDESLKEHAA